MLKFILLSLFSKSMIILFIVFFSVNAVCEVSKISYRGYTDCYQISNDSVKLIVVAEAGGRILNYSLNNKNIIFEDETLNGKTIADFNVKSFEPDGGRFDVRGSANFGKLRDSLWIGPYTTEITGRYSMKTTSLVDYNIGINICREFILDSVSSHLKIRQTMTNRSNAETNLYFWGRIFSPIDGKVVIPLNPNSKYSSKWGYVNAGNLVSDNATDSLIHVLDTILTFRASKTGAKMRYVADPNPGWILYGLNEQLLLMKYKVDVSKTYLSEFGESLIFYTDGAARVELEPVFPAQKLGVGQSHSVEEDWWLLRYPDAITKDFDGNAAATYAHSKATLVSDNITDIKQVAMNENDNFFVFPNPTKSIARIYGAGVSSVQVYSIGGNLVLNQKYSGLEQTNVLNVESFSNGIYFLKIYYNKGLNFVTRKFFITN